MIRAIIIIFTCLLINSCSNNGDIETNSSKWSLDTSMRYSFTNFKDDYIELFDSTYCCGLSKDVKLYFDGSGYSVPLIIKVYEDSGAYDTSEIGWFKENPSNCDFIINVNDSSYLFENEIYSTDYLKPILNSMSSYEEENINFCIKLPKKKFMRLSFLHKLNKIFVNDFSKKFSEIKVILQTDPYPFFPPPPPPQVGD